MVKAVAVSVTGRVQGVGYRAWTAEAARVRGLRGWVRNRHDGTVEALLVGDEAAVDDLLAALWDGPPAARIERVAVQLVADAGGTGFRVLPTG